VFEGDLFTPLPADLRGTLDLVVSNPPYVDREDADSLSREVLADPDLALFGGVAIYERLAPEAIAWLRPGGSIVVEIGADQGAAVADIIERAGFEHVAVLADLAGHDRIVSGTRPA
jgi:release factor glutamine methyltransferase